MAQKNAYLFRGSARQGAGAEPPSDAGTGKGNGREPKPAPTPRPSPFSAHRFENWKLFLALARPYFLRSTTRLSRVRKPAAFSAGRRLGS